MGCLMKNGIATYGSLPHDYYVLKINGRANSIHQRYEEALREGLLLRYQFPHDDIKVCEITEEVMQQGTVLHCPPTSGQRVRDRKAKLTCSRRGASARNAGTAPCLVPSPPCSA
jgi:hypothetical protein